MKNWKSRELPLLAISPEHVLYISEGEKDGVPVTKIRLSNGRMVKIAPETEGFAEAFAENKFRGRDGKRNFVRFWKYLLNPSNVTAVEDIGDGTVSVHFPKSCLKTALPSAGSLDYSSLLALVEAMGDDMVALEASGEISGI